jgi:hypothetical protein
MPTFCPVFKPAYRKLSACATGACSSTTIWKRHEPSWAGWNLYEQAKACSTQCGICFSLFVCVFQSSPFGSAQFLDLRRSEPLPGKVLLQLRAAISPGVTDISGSQNVSGSLIEQTSASLPPSLTARFWTFGPGTTTVDIQVSTPEPASASLMLAALIALVLLRTTSLPRV